MQVLVHCQEHLLWLICGWFRVMLCKDIASHPFSLCKSECPKPRRGSNTATILSKSVNLEKIDFLNNVLWNLVVSDIIPGDPNALASLPTRGGKHSPPGDTFQKSGGLRATMVETPLFPMVKSYPNEEFLTSIIMSFDVDFTRVDPRFWIGKVKGPYRDDFSILLRFLWKVTF